jgi:hypothetical protein
MDDWSDYSWCGRSAGKQKLPGKQLIIEIIKAVIKTYYTSIAFLPTLARLADGFGLQGNPTLHSHIFSYINTIMLFDDSLSGRIHPSDRFPRFSLGEFSVIGLLDIH